MTKIFDLPERGFEPQIFSNFSAHDLNFHGKIKSKQASKRDGTLPKDTLLTLQEIAEQPEKNAFEALKKPRNRKNEKQKPLKTVTNTRSAPAVTKTKQPKIYDESNGRKSLAGSKKIEMRYLLFNYQ